ncbi:acetyltransferase [Pararhizobium polonicum]|uniref:Acetyltransferase n=1 Tax=Pararhizobium polonicum TaxID=1612624 RepID=A0A1C7NVP5_9HYPH|nr:GNAT family N-acetyltransferase [Pararhizobium polonicum]OBZ93063.1 acetyltransferase [Pararhizobium polonicum]
MGKTHRRRSSHLSFLLQADPFPPNDVLNALWVSAWGADVLRDFSGILSRSLAHVGAYDGGRLVGFVNVAWDGGVHAFLLDTCVDPQWRRQGIATRLVNEAERLARNRGAQWLHVDYEPHLEGFYRACGFRSTQAGLIDLRRSAAVPIR